VDDTGTLVRHAQEGDRGAFGELVGRFQDMVYGCAYAVLGDFHLAEDVSVDAFLAAYQGLGELREPEAFPGWLRRIVLRQCRRQLRRRRAGSVSLDAAADVASPGPGPAEVVEAREAKGRVMEALAKLPGPQRMATTLFYINGYSQKEIADFLEVPVATVNNRLHDSRRQLKKRMLDMVKDELEAKAPDPSEMSGRITFLLGLAERLAKGEPILYVLKTLEQEAESQALRAVIREVHDSVDSGGTLCEPLAAHAKLFPPMVIWLIEAGEYLWSLNDTARMAADWLQRGEYNVDPYAFAWFPFGYLQREIKKGLAKGVTALVIDTRRTKEVPRAKGKPKLVWLQRELPSGSLEDVWPLPGRVGEYLVGLRALTILDEHQKGEAITGNLRMRLQPQDAAEIMLPVTYRPFRDGEEVRILLQT